MKPTVTSDITRRVPVDSRTAVVMITVVETLHDGRRTSRHSAVHVGVSERRPG